MPDEIINLLFSPFPTPSVLSSTFDHAFPSSSHSILKMAASIGSEGSAGLKWQRKIYTPAISRMLDGQQAGLRSGEDAFYDHNGALAPCRGRLSLPGSGQNRLYQDRLLLGPGSVCLAGI